MFKSHLPLTIVLAFAVSYSVTSTAIAAPQEGVFKRSTDTETKKPDTSTEETKAIKKARPSGSTITKESNAKITEQSDGWVTISDDESNTQWRFPGKPTYKEFKFYPIAGRDAVVNHFYKVLIDNRTEVAYSWMDLHEAPSRGKQLNDSLEGAVKGAVVNVLGQLNQMEKITVNKVQGREYDYTFSLRDPRGNSDLLISGYARVFIKGNRQYQMHVLTPKGKEEPELTKKYFDSLMINETEM
jgi:hypothetical protein